MLGRLVLGVGVVWFSAAWFVGPIAWAGHGCFDRSIGVGPASDQIAV